jgi:hypothetical protein
LKVFEQIDVDEEQGISYLSSTADFDYKNVILRGLQFNKTGPIWEAACWANGPHGFDRERPISKSGLCKVHIIELASTDKRSDAWIDAWDC